MTIDFKTETLIPLSKAGEELPGGRHLSTVNRWWRRGVRSVRLETVMVGGKRYTTREALHRFFAATTAASLTENGNAAPPSPPHQPKFNRAADELQEMLSTTRRRRE